MPVKVIDCEQTTLPVSSLHTFETKEISHCVLY